MKHKVLRTDRAEADLEEILGGIALHSRRAAKRLARDITEQCRMLARSPKMGRARDELGTGVRSLVVDKYLLFYRIQDQTVRLLRILYGARHLDESLMEE